MQKIIFYVTCWILCINLKAQSAGSYPDHFSSYFLNTSTINPAFIPKTGRVEAIFQSKVRKGLYRDINTISTTVQKTFNYNKNNWHSGRFIFSNETEGPYISNPKMYGNYSIQIKLNDKASLATGIAIGFSNPNFRTPTKSINTILPDGSLGIIFNNKSNTIGISSSQIFNTNYNSLTLKRYYNVIYFREFILDQNTVLNGRILGSYFVDIPIQTNISMSALFGQSLECVLGYKSRNGCYIGCSYITNKKNEHPLRFTVLYNSSILGANNPISESLEFLIGFNY